MKIAIVGDVHVGNQVRTRKDDYFETCLNKLETILKENDKVILLGDLLNTPVLDTFKIQCLYSLLKKYNKEVYTILGNHDVYCMNPSTEKTTIGLLDLVGVVKIIKEFECIEIDNHLFQSLPLNFKDIEKGNYKEGAIYLGHHFYELGCADSITKPMCEKHFGKGKALFLGHDHKDYDLETLPSGFKIYRPGSLLRNAGTSYNLTRKINYYQLDTETDAITCVEVLHKKSEDVFTEDILNCKKKKQELFVSRIDDLISRYSNGAKRNSEYSVMGTLKELETPETYMQYIVQCHKVLGVELT